MGFETPNEERTMPAVKPRSPLRHPPNLRQFSPDGCVVLTLPPPCPAPYLTSLRREAGRGGVEFPARLGKGKGRGTGKGRGAEFGVNAAQTRASSRHPRAAAGHRSRNTPEM
jgi:hypothetical protein